MEIVPSKPPVKKQNTAFDWLGWISFSCAMLFVCSFVLIFTDGFSLPSSIALGRIYVSKVVAGDIDALKLYADGPAFCLDSILDQAKRDVRYLAHAEIGELNIVSRRTNGSSDTIEFVEIMLTFRRSESTTWQHGRIFLITNRKWFGRRYFCTELSMGSEYW